MLVSTDLVPAGFGAITFWPFVFVRPGSRDDKGLIGHELVHYREQAWRTPVWWARYLLSPMFRQAAEVRAYRRQIELGGVNVMVAAHYLSTRYRLDVSFTAAVELLARPA